MSIKVTNEEGIFPVVITQLLFTQKSGSQKAALFQIFSTNNLGEWKIQIPIF